MNISLSAFAPENLVSRDGFGSSVPRQPAHLHIQAESGAYLRDSSRVPRRRPFIYFKPPYAIGSLRYSQGDGVHTPLSWLVLYPRLVWFLCLSTLVFSCVILDYPRHGHVLSGTIIISMMCVHELYLQG